MSPEELSDFYKKMEKEDPEGWSRSELSKKASEERVKSANEETIACGCGCFMALAALAVIVPLVVLLWRSAFNL